MQRTKAKKSKIITIFYKSVSQNWKAVFSRKVLLDFG